MNRFLFNRAVLIAFALLGFSAHAFSQSAKEVWRPGDVIGLDVSFDGERAKLIKTVNLFLIHESAVSPGQEVLLNQFGNADRFTADADGVFHIRLQIPAEAASGDYTPTINAAEEKFGFQYKMAQTGLGLYTVSNDKAIPAPAIHVKQLPRK